MEVILLEKIRNLGTLGDKVTVKSGYGRNFLIPNGKAVPANTYNVAKFEERRAELEKAAAAQLEQAKARATQLDVLNITLNANASEEGKLYGSVGTIEIQHAIQEAGHEVEKREILLPNGAFHEVGEYEVDIQVHTDVTATVRIKIEAAA